MSEDPDRLNPADASSQVDGRPEPEAAEGVLGALPRTRPQRASPRRAAQAKAKQASGKQATRAKAKQASGKQATQAKAGRAESKAAAKAKRKPAPKKAPPNPASAPPTRPRAPKQGYEPEEDLQIGRTVHPPSAVELAESVADIFLELASAGLKSGGRVLRDALSPLRRS